MTHRHALRIVDWFLEARVYQSLTPWCDRDALAHRLVRVFGREFGPRLDAQLDDALSELRFMAGRFDREVVEALAQAKGVLASTCMDCGVIYRVRLPEPAGSVGLSDGICARCDAIRSRGECCEDATGLCCRPVGGGPDAA